MTQELIMGALNMLNDDLLKETDELRRKNRRVAVKWRWAGIAACLLLAFSWGVFQYIGNQNETTMLPLLSIKDFSSMGAGFGAEMAFDVSELVSGNPWSETDDLSTLPVFQNPIYIDESDYFKVTGVNVVKMWEILLDTAERLDLDADNLQMSGPSPETDSSEPMEINDAVVMAVGDGIKLEVDAALTVTITFDPSVELPDGYNNTYHASYEEKAALGEYFREAYRELIGWENPSLAVTGGGYNTYSEQTYRVEFYNGEGDLTERILNYNFQRIVFYGNGDADQMGMIRIIQPDCSQKLGDYPIISPAKARKLLLAGEYVTSSP